MPITDELEISPEEQVEEREAQVEPQEEPEEQDEPTAQASTPEKPAEPKEEKTVSLSALHEERQRRKELQAQIAKMEERFEAFRQSLEKPKEAPAPSYEEDPGAHLLHEVGTVKKTAEELRAWREQQEQASIQDQTIRQWAQRFNATEQAFSQDHPDYNDAASYLRNSRLREYKVLGWSEPQAQQALINETIQIGMYAESQGKNPAEVFYTLARDRGYQPKSPEQSASTLEKLKKNVERTSTLGPGGKSNAAPSLADIAAMDDDEFDKATENWAKLWQ